MTNRFIYFLVLFFSAHVLFLSHAESRPSRYDKRSFSIVKGLVDEGELEQAAIRLFDLLQKTKNKKEKIRITYTLALTLYNMGLNQASAYQFIKVAKSGSRKYLKKALEHLSLAGDSLGDDVLLDYVVNKIRIRDFPRAHRSMLYFRIGESFMKAKRYSKAIYYFKKVNSSYVGFFKAKYLEAFLYAKTNRPKKAIKVFDYILSFKQGEGFLLDSSRVSALLGKARTYYQMKSWNKALYWYNQVPRDTYMWHEALEEKGWAFLRVGKLRSALSTFQSLHSSFYENFYQPESLILRSIIYLYICQYNEIEKVLTLFSKEYKPIYRQVKRYLTVKNYLKAYNEVALYAESKTLTGRLSSKIINKIRYESFFRKSYFYIKNLERELEMMSQFSPRWRQSGLGRFSKRVLQRRITNAKKALGRWIFTYLSGLNKSLANYFEQSSIVKFEMISGKKEVLKEELLARGEEAKEKINNKSRNFYIQNGFEYWPYQGESWLDELGNYQYLGVSSCE